MAISAALSAYNRAQSIQPGKVTELSNYNKAVVDFQHSLKEADAIYQTGAASNIKVKSVESPSSSRLDSEATIFSESLQNLRNTLNQAEKVSAKALINEASAADMAAAISNADIVLQNITAIRDKIVSAVLDITKMPI